MVTIRDVARKAGVSVATVSATINGSAFVSPELRTRVERARADLDYHPDGIARSLRIRTSQTVGLIISDITNPFFTALVRGVEDTAQARGYAVTLCNTDDSLEKERAYTKLLRSPSGSARGLSKIRGDERPISLCRPPRAYRGRRLRCGG